MHLCDNVKNCTQSVVTFPRNMKGNVMTTFRLGFSVSKAQHYSNTYIQELLREGLQTLMNGRPLLVPEFGEIHAITLLGQNLHSFCAMHIILFEFLPFLKKYYLLLIYFPGASGKSFYNIGDDSGTTI